MSRPLKFRVWDKRHQHMTHNFTLEQLRRWTPGVPNVVKERADESLVFMQYTGLKDKNGTPIYEGDIYLSDMDKKYGLKPKVVEWQRCGFGPLEDEQKIEVIGNVMEHPHLLDAQQGSQEDNARR